MAKIALVTGSTSGIGRATALKFAENNFDLILTGRRNDRLQALARELKKKYQVNVLPLCFDVRVFEEAETHLTSLKGKWKNIDVLVNNAGLAAGFGPFDQGSLDDWNAMLDTNVKGLLYVTKMIIPGMIKRRRGQIINIGSIAGKEVYPGGNVYCASKFAVEALTRALRIDLLAHNIRVTGISPGAVETEFSLVRYKGDKEKAKSVYKGFKPLSAVDVAEAIWFAVSRPAHVNINDMVIMPTAQADTKNFFKDTA